MPQPPNPTQTVVIALAVLPHRRWRADWRGDVFTVPPRHTTHATAQEGTHMFWSLPYLEHSAWYTVGAQ